LGGGESVSTGLTVRGVAFYDREDEVLREDLEGQETIVVEL